MDEADGALSAVVDRSDRLAQAGEWSDLYGSLREHGQETLLSHPALAYRYAEALFHTGRMDELVDFAGAYEETARSRSDAAGVLRALNLAGISAFELGRTDDAVRRFEKLMELAEAEASTDMMARAANGLGSVAVLEGRYGEALSHFRLAAPLYERLGRTRGLAQLHHNFGICFRDLGRYDDAVDAFRRSTELAEGLGYGFLTGMSTTGRAEVELRRGDPTYARRLAERGLRQIREVGDPISEADALRVLALAGAARAADPDEAVRDLREALRLARETGSTLVEAEVERDLGGLLVERGRIDEGRELLRSAVDLFDQVGAVAYEAETRETLAALGGDGGD